MVPEVLRQALELRLLSEDVEATDFTGDGVLVGDVSEGDEPVSSQQNGKQKIFF